MQGMLEGPPRKEYEEVMLWGLHGGGGSTGVRKSMESQHKIVFRAK